VTGQIIFCDGGADCAMIADRVWIPSVLGTAPD
jgi:hypothetical protein